LSSRYARVAINFPGTKNKNTGGFSHQTPWSCLTPDVILVASTVNLISVEQLSRTVPVVFVGVADPVAQGFVASVRRPGGNLTGFSLLEFSLGGKWLDLLKQVAPSLTRSPSYSTLTWLPSPNSSWG
jgi:hypothetical protein